MSRAVLMGSVVATLFAALSSCAAPVAHVEESGPLAPAPLARFMREDLNVPFAFVMLETATAQRDRRVHRAAIALREAAHDLVHWVDPPVMSNEGRDVFVTYAQHLEHHVTRLEDAAVRSDASLAVDTVEQIRQTCNQCHRFFRPTSIISSDVAYDWYSLDFGGIR
jgi:hypothetical protein